VFVISTDDFAAHREFFQERRSMAKKWMARIGGSPDRNCQGLYFSAIVFLPFNFV
jgi:hypothetical protein